MKRMIYILSLILSISLFYINIYAYENGYVNCSSLNVRTSPNTNCNIVTTIKRGTAFEIVYTQSGWYNIRLSSGVTGFVSADYVTKEMPLTKDVASDIVADAQKYLGYRYSYGSSGPNSFDCSGFTSYIFKKHGYSLPRTSVSQGSEGVLVNKENLALGDLVFFSNRSDRRINHVGIYIGNDQFIHASTSYRGVVIDHLGSSYYKSHYVCGRRVL